MLNQEVWKDIKDYEGFYQVSNLGRVKSLPRNGTIKTSRILKQNIVCGYCQVTLQKQGNKSYKKVHRLVAEAFILNLENKREVNHIDGNKRNNVVKNLEWVTTSENQLHSCYVLKNNVRPVKQFTKSNKLIKEWNSIAEAGRKLRIHSSDIGSCCLGHRKTAGGYVWKYKENNRKVMVVC